jgi:hypothetical protein
MNSEQFRHQLSTVKQAKSISGKVYKIISVSATYVEFVREHNSKSERISIIELYNLYSKEKNINTSVAKSYISGRVQSPAVAILNSINFYPQTLNQSRDIEIVFRKQISVSPKKEPIGKIKDETKFFMALTELIEEKYLLSKSIGKPINSSHVFLSNNFRDYNFDKSINGRFEKILLALRSNNSFSSESLSQHVDGLIWGHPKLKSRIIEFDEEQHFTPARKDTLKFIKEMLPDLDVTGYMNYCSDLNYLNRSVLKKHRIKNKLKGIPKSFIDFTRWLDLSNEKTSGYIEEKNGFEFLGGRIAQRAYYDCLKDTAHLSPKNKILVSPLRFAKKAFEDKAGTTFSNLTIQDLKRILEFQFKRRSNGLFN